MKRKVFITCMACLCSIFMLSAQGNIKTLVNDLKSKETKKVLVVSHRGDWRNAPENSLQAYKNCIENGVDMIEIDLQKTKDGQLIIMHDRTVDRTTTGKGKVADYTFDEIRKLKLRDGIGRATHHSIPTLREVLELSKGKILINIDKGYDYFKDIYDLLVETNTINQVVIKAGLSYDRVKAENGEVLDKVIFMPIVNLNAKDAEALIDSYKKMKPVAIECCLSEATPEALRLLKKVQENGSKIWINSLWPSLNAGHDDDVAVDFGKKDETWGWLLEQGASLIQTDRPFLLMDYLKSKGRR